MIDTGLPPTYDDQKFAEMAKCFWELAAKARKIMAEQERADQTEQAEKQHAGAGIGAQGRADPGRAGGLCRDCAERGAATAAAAHHPQRPRAVALRPHRLLPSSRIPTCRPTGQSVPGQRGRAPRVHCRREPLLHGFIRHDGAA